MVKKFNASQFKSQMRRIQSQQNQALRKLDIEIHDGDTLIVYGKIVKVLC